MSTGQTQGTTLQGVISEANMSQSGKSVSVKVGNTWYSCKLMGIQQDVGKQISFVTTDSFWNDKTMHWINEYHELGTPSGDALATHAPQQQATNIPQQQQTYVVPPRAEEFKTPSVEPPMAFISNTVAHAIQAGAIKQPTDVNAWVVAANAAIGNLKN